MCGIWCSVGFPPDKSAIDLVAHRGPDGRGWREFKSSSGPVALGHRRLAIIDVSDAASQPMVSADGRTWVTYNGEIYNYLELREELQALGYQFRTRSDTEVILAAYDRWGEACLDRFIGMFAFVLYQPGTERLFAARDRFGIKPLYYYVDRRGVAFASEIKQLLRLPGCSPRMNLERIHDYLVSGITDHTEQTSFAGVLQLRSGHAVSLDLRSDSLGSPLPVRRWYQLPAPGTLDLSEDAAARRFRELLTESVRLHLRSDVPIGSCLSGGLDSSSIVCLLAEELKREDSSLRVNTISACYDDTSVDERPFIAPVVAQTGAEVHYVFPKADDLLQASEQIVWHQDEPYGSTSIFAQWSVFARARREKIKVMLDGQGADEQLAGYHGGFKDYHASLARRGRLVSLLRAMLQRRGNHGVPLNQQLQELLFSLVSEMARNFVLRGRTVLAQYRWLQSEVFAKSEFPARPFDAAVRREGLGPIRNIGDLCLAMTQATNLPMLLRYEDRNSMAHGVEARVPFLDHRLVELSIGLGERHKIVGAETKRVLRTAMTGILPEPVRTRRDKLGFATPEESWFRGPLKAAIREGVEQTLRLYPGLLNEAGTRQLTQAMLDGQTPFDWTLWRVVNLGMWGRIFRVSL